MPWVSRSSHPPRSGHDHRHRPCTAGEAVSCPARGDQAVRGTARRTQDGWSQSSCLQGLCEPETGEHAGGRATQKADDTMCTQSQLPGTSRTPQVSQSQFTSAPGILPSVGSPTQGFDCFGVGPGGPKRHGLFRPPIALHCGSTGLHPSRLRAGWKVLVHFSPGARGQQCWRK